MKSNSLIEATYKPSAVYEMRLLTLLLMQIKAKEKMSADTKYVVHYSELAKLTDVEVKYTELKAASVSLLQSHVKISHSPEGVLLDKWVNANLVSLCEYSDGEGTVTVTFTPFIIPYLSELRTRFTKYKAEHVMSMGSSYSVRIYELCLQEQGGKRTYELDQFRKMLQLSKAYDRDGNLRARILDPAVEDINKHTDIKVSYVFLKRGRKSTHVEFTINRKPKTVHIPQALDFQSWVNRYGLAKGKGWDSWDVAKVKLKRKYATYRKDPLKWVEKNGEPKQVEQLKREMQEQREEDRAF